MYAIKNALRDNLHECIAAYASLIYVMEMRIRDQNHDESTIEHKPYSDHSRKE